MRNSQLDMGINAKRTTNSEHFIVNTAKSSEMHLNLSPARYNISANALVTTDYIVGEEKNVRRILQIVKDDSYESGIAASADGGYDSTRNKVGTPAGFIDICCFFPVGQKTRWFLDKEDGVWKEQI